MQFKNILATIAALAVASAVASPVEHAALPSKRNDQQAQLKEALLSAAQAAQQQGPATQQEVDLYFQAEQQYGKGWCGPQCPPPVLYQPCPPPVRFYTTCYGLYPYGYADWHDVIVWGDDGYGKVDINHSFNEGLLNGNELNILKNVNILGTVEGDQS